MTHCPDDHPLEPEAAACTPHEAIGRRPRVRRNLLVGAGVLSLLAAGIVATTMPRGDEPSRDRTDLVVFAEYRDADDAVFADLSLSARADDPSGRTSFATGAQLIGIRRSATDPINESVPTDEGRGGIVPVGDRAVVHWRSDRRHTVGLVGQGGDVEVLYESLRPTLTYLSPDGQHLLYASEGRPSGSECHVGALTEPPAAIGTVQRCAFSADGTVLAFRRDVSGNDLVTTYDRDGQELTSAAMYGDPWIGPDGTRAMVSLRGRMYLRDLRSTDVLAEGQGEAAEPVGWSAGDDAGAYAFAGPEVATIGVLRADGTNRLLLEGVELTGELTADGEHLIGATRDGDTISLQRVPTRGGEPEVLGSGAGLDWLVLPGADRSKLLVWTDGGGPVWLGDAATGTMEETGSLPASADLSDIAYDDATGTILASVVDKSGNFALWALNGEVVEISTGHRGLAFGPTIGDTQVVLTAAADQTHVVAIRSGKATRLGSAPRIDRVWADGTSLLWTEFPEDADLSALIVRRTSITGDDPPATLAEGLQVVATSSRWRRPLVARYLNSQVSVRRWFEATAP